MTATIRRIDLSATEDIETTLQHLCSTMDAGGYRLVTSFVYDIHLILIFQK